MIKTYKFRAYINSSTQEQTIKMIDICRILYNLCLEQRIYGYKRLKKNISCYDQIKQLPSLKKAFPEFKNVPSQSLQEVIERLDKAYQAFFRRIKSGEKSGFPRFKSSDRYDSIILKRTGWKIDGSNLIIPKLGIFKIKFHRQIPKEAKIKTITIKKTKTNKWHVFFCCTDIIPNILPKNDKTIAFDVGCESFITDSDNSKIDNPRFLKKSEDRIKKLQQKISKQKKGSTRRNKTKFLLNNYYEKVSNQRLDFHHKVAKYYVDNYGKIIHENLESWTTNYKSLNRSIRDAAWFQFFNILHCKAAEAGREIIEVPSKDTSQICSSCGVIVSKELSTRIHNCSNCGLNISRDYNSALNILRLGTSLQV